MKKKYLSILLGLCILLLSACQNTGQTIDKKSDTTVKEEAKKEETPKKEMDQNSKMDEKPSGEKIILYTNNGSNGRKEWVHDEAAKAGFNVEVVELGGGAIVTRAISEKNQPIADVIWGPSEAQFTSMKKENIFAKWTPNWVNELDSSSYINDEISYPYEVQPKILLVNSELYTAETAPKDYTDLWEKEEFHGKYAVPPKFDGTTNRAIISGILMRYRDDNGEMGISDKGWEAIRLYFKHGYRTMEGENDFENMAKGKVPITFTYASGLKKKAETFHHNPLVVTPEIGLPTNTNHIGIINKNNQAKLEESIRFANWLCSAEVIGRYAQAHGILPANKTAVGQATEEMKKLGENLKVQDIDWDFVDSHIEEWISKIELEIVK
ncbi:extracellular solute-binding protein [Clostridiales bacterium COT073_COT-073]|nr:extracellular solute-binding protein [Clostridiales bacterium COT073_COT-073]